MLTSGTTGRPKGCIKTHQELSAQLHHQPSRQADGRRLNELLVVPIYYNSGRKQPDHAAQLRRNGHLRERFDPTDTLATIQNERIACLALAPQQCEELLNHPELDRYDKSSLRVLRKAGLPFQKRSVQAIIERITPNVFQGYGGTEFSEASILLPEEQLSKIGSAGLAAVGHRDRGRRCRSQAAAAGRAGHHPRPQPQRLRRLLQRPPRPRPRRSWTAGIIPAISASSTTTAISTSPAARRT